MYTARSTLLTLCLVNIPFIVIIEVNIPLINHYLRSALPLYTAIELTSTLSSKKVGLQKFSNLSQHEVICRRDIVLALLLDT